MKTLHWKQLTAIEVGGAICLPVIMVGHKLCSTYGLPSALLGIFLGNMILFFMAYVTALMSFEHKTSTPENARKYFGDQGAKLFALFLLIAKTSWFAIQLNLMVLSLQEIFQIDASIGLTIILGSCILIIALKGLEALSRLTAYCMPLLVITMLTAILLADRDRPMIGTAFLTYGSISIAMGAAITAVIDMPTYFRHAYSKKDGIIAVALLFLVAIPLIEGVGVYLAYCNPNSSVSATLMKADLFYWNVWVMLFMLLAGWTTNNTNLYSAAICLKTILPHQLTEKSRLVFVASLGVILALAHVLEHLSLFLQILGICIGGMGAVILANYLSRANSPTVFNLSVWGIGMLMGFGNLFDKVSITSIAVLDAFLIATILILLGKVYEIFDYRTIG